MLTFVTLVLATAAFLFGIKAYQKVKLGLRFWEKLSNLEGVVEKLDGRLEQVELEVVSRKLKRRAGRK